MGNGLFDTAAVLSFTLVATLDRLAATAGGAAGGALIARAGGERPAAFRARLRTFVSLGVVVGTLGAAFAIQIDTRPACTAPALAVLAVCAHSVGEVWESSGGFALGFGLAPDHAQGQCQGLFGIGFDAGQALAPVILTGAVLALGHTG